MAASGGIILNSLRTIHRFGVSSGIFPGVLSQVRHYAARKGTRERARKKKVKVEVKKLTFHEKIQKSKKVNIVKPEALTEVDDNLPVAEDDVYIASQFKTRIFPFAEAIKCHRETLHPTMFDDPHAMVNAFIELNMQGVKKTKPVESFQQIVVMKNKFDHGEIRNILVFCKEEDHIRQALDGGAALAGGADIVKLIVDGEISLHGYDTVIAHPSMMPEILAIRGLLKRKHPSIKGGTLGPDIEFMIRNHLHGIRYEAKAFTHFPDFGITTIPIGPLDMDINDLEENLQCAVDSVMLKKPKRPGSFITRIRIVCPPSEERLKVDHTLYVQEEDPETNKKGDGEDDEDDVAVAVSV